MHTTTYLLHAITNLHVGAEGSNAGIVDNMVQRDPVTGVPVIHASSLKGSLRELFEEKLYPKEKEKHPDIIDIFGLTGDEKGSRSPKYSFFQADLLSLPVRSNIKPFFSATSPETLENFLKMATLFQNSKAKEWKLLLQPIIDTHPGKGSPKYFQQEELIDAAIDDYLYQPVQEKNVILTKEHSDLLGSDLVLFHHDDFKALCQRLPVVARNKLVNSESKNLWYEEIVPRESRFVFQVGKTIDEDKLEKGLKSNNHLFQVGGNASIGYGFCHLTPLNN